MMKTFTDSPSIEVYRKLIFGSIKLFYIPWRRIYNFLPTKKNCNFQIMFLIITNHFTIFNKNLNKKGHDSQVDFPSC